MKTQLFFLTFGFLLLAQALPAQSLPSDSEIRGILSDRVSKQKQSVGIVAGVIGPEGRRVVSFGGLDLGNPHVLNGDTIFEIGSITKVFTSLLLSDMVQHGEVALTDPVSKYLPAGVKMPERNGRQITLLDLATHTSGLPRLPTNLKPKDPANPYAEYTVAQLYEFLSSYQLTRDIGSQYEYSNLGGGLLGHVLSLRAGMDYAALIINRVTGPLGMKDTSISLSPEMGARMATGHDNNLNAVDNWDMPTLAGAGALRSTANDLLTFLAAALGYTKTPLAPAMAAMLTVRRPSGTPGMEAALGWQVLTRDGQELYAHDGGTGGYRSFIGYDPKNRVGVVVLANTATNAGVVDIGLHLLNPKSPLLTDAAFQAPKEHKEVPVDAKLFDGYVGRYQLAPNFFFTVTREGDRLFVQATGQAKFQVFPEGPKDYFLKVTDAQITFETDAQGKAASLVLHQNGVNQPAKRVE